MDFKQRENRNWTEKHTLSEQEFRQLILEKMERARLLQLANENRELNELA